MKILYFHQYFATRRSATGTRSFELARRFVERGHDVTMVSSAAQLPRDEGPGAIRLRPVVRRAVEGIDLVLLNVPYSNYFSYPLRLAAFAAFTARRERGRRHFWAGPTSCSPPRRRSPSASPG